MKNAIEDTVDAVEALNTNRSSLHSAFFEAEKAATKTTSEEKTTEPLTNQIAESIARQVKPVYNRLDRQEEKIDAIMACITTMQNKKDAEQNTGRRTEETPIGRIPETRTIDPRVNAVTDKVNKDKE